MANQAVQRTGASRFAQRQIERHRRLAPVADLRWPHMRTLRLLITLVPVLFMGCTTSHIGLCNNPQKMRERILQQVPFGTTGQQASRTMQTSGFSCESRTNAVFFDMAAAGGVTHSNITYLACSRERVIPLMLDLIWIIGLPLDADGCVTNVYVQIWDSAL